MLISVTDYVMMIANRNKSCLRYKGIQDSGKGLFLYQNLYQNRFLFRDVSWYCVRILFFNVLYNTTYCVSDCISQHEKSRIPFKSFCPCQKKPPKGGFFSEIRPPGRVKSTFGGWNRFAVKSRFVGREDGFHYEQRGYQGSGVPALNLWFGWRVGFLFHRGEDAISL